MKYILIPFFLLIFIYCAKAQDFEPLDASQVDYAYFPHRAVFRGFQKTEEKKLALSPIIRMLYSRPQKNKRKIFGGLIKYGKMWRLGANESTEIYFYKDVKVGDTSISAGRYTMYAIPNENTWEIIINRDNDMWGNYSYNKEKDVCRMVLPVKESKKTIENLSIVFYEKDATTAIMKIGWDQVYVEMPIKTN